MSGTLDPSQPGQPGQDTGAPRGADAEPATGQPTEVSDRQSLLTQINAEARFTAKRDELTAAALNDIQGILGAAEQLSPEQETAVRGAFARCFKPAEAEFDLEPARSLIGRDRASLAANFNQIDAIERALEGLREAAETFNAEISREIAALSASVPHGFNAEVVTVVGVSPELPRLPNLAEMSPTELVRDVGESRTVAVASQTESSELLQRVEERRVFRDAFIVNFRNEAEALGSVNSFSRGDMQAFSDAVDTFYELDTGVFNQQAARDALAAVFMTLNSQQAWFLEASLEEFGNRAGILAEPDKVAWLDLEIEDRGSSRAIPFHDVVTAGEFKVEFSSRRAAGGRQGACSIDITNAKSGANIKLVDMRGTILTVETLRRESNALRHLEASGTADIREQRQALFERFISLRESGVRLYSAVGVASLASNYGGDGFMRAEAAQSSASMLDAFLSGRRETTYLLSPHTGQCGAEHWDSLVVRRVGEEVRISLRGPSVAENRDVFPEIEVVLPPGTQKHLAGTIQHLLRLRNDDVLLRLPENEYEGNAAQSSQAKPGKERKQEQFVNQGIGELGRDILTAGSVSVIRNIALVGRSDLPEIRLAHRYVIENLTFRDIELRFRAVASESAGSKISGIRLKGASSIGLLDCRQCEARDIWASKESMLYGDLSGSLFRGNVVLAPTFLDRILRRDGPHTSNLTLIGIRSPGLFSLFSGNRLPAHATRA